jgi:hypothetical protein
VTVEYIFSVALKRFCVHAYIGNLNFFLIPFSFFRTCGFTNLHIERCLSVNFRDNNYRRILKLGENSLGHSQRYRTSLSVVSTPSYSEGPWFGSRTKDWVSRLKSFRDCHQPLEVNAGIHNTLK